MSLLSSGDTLSSPAWAADSGQMNAFGNQSCSLLCKHSRCRRPWQSLGSFRIRKPVSAMFPYLIKASP